MKKSWVLMVVILAALNGCALFHSHGNGYDSESSMVQVMQPPGVVEEVWEEPMVDVVDVPPGLDPEGNYYRPGHQEVQEVRQGRWNYHRKQRDN